MDLFELLFLFYTTVGPLCAWTIVLVLLGFGIYLLIWKV